MKMSEIRERPRRTLRQSTKLQPNAATPTSTPTSNPYKRISYSAKQILQETPSTKSQRKTPQSTPRGGASGTRRGRKLATPKRPECFNNKHSKYNDYHYGSDFDEDSEPEHESEDDQSEESETNISNQEEETLDFNVEDIEDITSSSTSNLPIWLNNEIEVEPLIIPQSSDDLILNDKNIILPLVSIYETIIKFYKPLRITPFKFEDFCACLSSPESSVLLVEIHVQILKSILREDEAMNVTYGPMEYKDSIQAAFYFVDHITWVDGLLTYFRTEKSLAKYTGLVKENDYPFCGIEIRVKIINVLLNIFYSTNAAREALLFDDIAHEDYCRICGRLGELICCETCTSVAHLGCINPPIIDPPEEWKCSTCIRQIVPGLIECVREEDKTSIRQDKLGHDRHGRTYWFLVRRILVESEDCQTSWYYSTKNQLVELIDSLSPTYEAELIQNINYHKEEIELQMDITESLTNQANTLHRKTYIEHDNGQLAQLQMSRELISKQNELEKIKAQEKILLKKHLEEAEKLKVEEEIKLKIELEKKRIREERLERRNKKKYGDDFDDFEDMDFEISQSEQNCTMQSLESKSEDGGESESLNKGSVNQPDKVNQNDTGSVHVENSVDTEIIFDEKTGISRSTEPPYEYLTGNSPKRTEQPVEQNSCPIKPSENNLEKPTCLPKLTEIHFEGSLKPIQAQIEKQVEILKAELLDNDKERMTRLKSIGLFKLGQENNYRNYVNYYSHDSTSLSKLQHNEERDKKRYMSHKFSLTPVSEFKWIGQYITFQNVIQIIKTSLINFENNIPLTLMHTNWHQLRKPWITSVNNCKSIHDFKNVVIIFRGCLRDCLFNNIWTEGIGHLKLVKMNQLERDELKKTEKKLKKNKDDEDDRFKIIHPFVKYTIPCKHQLWKQKGEEYRLHGQFGWIWMRNTRLAKMRTNYKYNLINGPYKYVIQVKSDNNKIKTMLIDPTVYNKLMAKRNLNLGKADEVKIKDEPKETLAAPTVPMKVEKVENTTIDESKSIKEEEAKESEPDIIKCVMQGMLNQLEEADSKPKPVVTPTKPPQPPKKYNTELINVSLGIVSANRILYPKIAHRINILDDLLAHRLKLVQLEETQLMNKYSGEYKFMQTMNNYKCYSYGCGKLCYSPLCQLAKMERSESAEKVFLRKLKPDIAKKTITFPLISTYTKNMKPNIFVLQNKELMKLARTGGRYTTPAGFSINNKINMLWNYQCGRPCFYRVWEYNFLNCHNLSSVGMGIRILYSCIRWDDLQVKPPINNDGRSQVTTDMEIITSEILQHRVLGQFLNKVQYLRRKEIVPIDLPKTVREITPSRLGLRKRKRTELQDKMDPTVVEEWVNESQFEIWEIRYYGDRVDRPKLEVYRRQDNSPNTRIKSGIILNKPDKLDPSILATKNSPNTNAMETVDPVQRAVHLSKRDNHVKINTSNKVQVPTASQQLQQQQALNRVESQQKSALQDKNKVQQTVQGKVVLHTVPSGIVSRQQPIQRSVVTVQHPIHQVVSHPNPQSIAAVALQQIQEKQQNKSQTNKKFFVSKTKEISPKPAVNQKGPQHQSPVAQLPQMQIIQSPTSTPQEQQQHRLQIVRTLDGKLQLKGLMHGQAAYQTADGKIHVLTSTANSSGMVRLEQQPGVQSMAMPKQEVVTTTANSQQIVMSTLPGNKQQIMMASTPGNKQQFVVTTPGSSPQFVVTTPQGNQQYVLASTSGNKQIVLTSTPPNKQNIVTASQMNQQGIIVATPNQFLQQPLINISSQAMKTVINNSSTHPPQLQQSTSRMASPNIIKSKQTPILISKNQASPNQSPIFINQNQILMANPQQQPQSTLVSNQGNKLICNDGTKTYIINASGLNEVQIRALANQFQQKKIIIKTTPEQTPQSSLGNGQQLVTTSQNTPQIITSSSGQQLIVMAQKPIVQSGVTTSPVTINQQIVSGSGIVGQIVPSPVTTIGQQQQVVVTMSQNARAGVTTKSIKIVPNLLSNQILSTSTGSVQRVMTNPTRAGQSSTMNRQILLSSAPMVFNPARMGQQIRLSPATLGQQFVPGIPTINRQIITSLAGQQMSSASMKPTTLPISIVSPSKPKVQTKLTSMVITTQVSTSSPNLAITATKPTVVMSPTKPPPATSPTKPTFSMSPQVRPTVAISPTTPTVPLMPAIGLGQTMQPIFVSSMKPVPVGTGTKPPALLQKPNNQTQVSSDQTLIKISPYQGITPMSTAQQISSALQQLVPTSPLSHQVTASTTAQINHPIPISMNSTTQQQVQTPPTTPPSSSNNVNSKITAQFFETPGGSKIVIQGGNKFSPEELLQIQTQLKKQFMMGAEKPKPVEPPPAPLNESLSSSIDESINLVVQNTKNKNLKKKIKSPNKEKDKLLENSQLGPSILPDPVEPSKSNKKLLKLQQINQRTKQLATVTKCKESLKKDIERKRTTMENELKIAIQKEIAQEQLLIQNAAVAAVQPTYKGLKRKSTSHSAGKQKKKKSRTKSEMDLTKKYCICNTPYDETKFYVGCEKCSNWFHGDCIGISQAMAKCLSDYICDLCQTKEKTYCLCKQPYDESQFYICCDKCQDWFHGRCIGIIQSESIKMDEYICPNCDPNTELNATNLKILNPDDFILLHKLIKQMILHKSAWAFIKPVDIKDAPNYYKIIKEPMDLQTVDLRVAEKVYSRLRDFIGDVTKIFDNCRYYNAENSEFYKLANNLEVFFKEKVILLRRKLLM